MKTVLAIFAFCLVGAMAMVLTDEQKQKLKTYKEACITETGVDATVVENAKKGNFPEGDEKFACFSSCMFKKIGVMDADGNIDEATARRRIPSGTPADKADELINRCKSITGTSVCDKGLKLVKCLNENEDLIQ